MPVIPSLSTDEVLYSPKRFYALENQRLDIESDSSLDIFGNVYLNGVLLRSADADSDFDRAFDSLLRPPAIANIPTITQITGSSTTTLPPTPVEYRPIICGTGSTITNWTANNDPVLRFWSGVYQTQNGANNDLAMYGAIKGTAGYAWPIVFDFDTSAGVQDLELVMYTASDPTWMLEVNGALAFGDTQINMLPGTGYHIFRLSFPLPDTRRIRISLRGGLHSIRVPAGESITRPIETITRRVAVLGDSYVDGAGSANLYPQGAGQFETFARRLITALNGQDGILAGVGGTGFVASVNPYALRLPTVLGFNPHVLIVNGSINDGTVPTGVTAAVSSFLASCAAVPEVYVIGTMHGSYTANHDAVQAGCVGFSNVKFIPMRAFINGTGNYDAPTGVGNRGIYLRADNSHPTIHGHRAIAKAINRAIVLATAA